MSGQKVGEKKFCYPKVAPAEVPRREEKVSALKVTCSHLPLPSPASLLPSEQNQHQEVSVHREWARSGQ